MEKTNHSDILLSEMEIPKDWGETVFVAVIFIIFLFFVLLAILEIFLFKYMPALAVFLSAIWLIIIFLLVLSACRRDGGVRQFLIKLAGILSFHQFAQIVQKDTSRKVLCFGYKLFGKNFYYLKIQCDGIKTVDWSPGQGSRGLNDWHLCVWFDKDMATTLNWTPSDKPRTGIYVGPSLNKYRTEKLGDLFIEFLHKADVPAAQCDQKTLNRLLGKCCITSSGLSPSGKVTSGESEYYAHSIKGWIEQGAKVRVLETRGLSLYVEPAVTESVHQITNTKS